MKCFPLILLAAIALLLVAVSSHACDGFCAPGYGYGYLYRNLDSNIPYFAAYPPVYYSTPIPRPYGYSPFAYPPGTQTPEIIEKPVEPETIINPYIEQPEPDANTQKSAGEGDEGKVTTARQPTPLVIYNPFVTASPPIVQVSK